MPGQTIKMPLGLCGKIRFLNLLGYTEEDIVYEEPLKRIFLKDNKMIILWHICEDATPYFLPTHQIVRYSIKDFEKSEIPCKKKISM